jgi:hypothetical protein
MSCDAFTDTNVSIQYLRRSSPCYNASLCNIKSHYEEESQDRTHHPNESWNIVSRDLPFLRDRQLILWCSNTIAATVTLVELSRITKIVDQTCPSSFGLLDRLAFRVLKTCWLISSRCLLYRQHMGTVRAFNMA